MTAPGYGKASQDWSYLTPKKAIAVQAGNVVDPSALSSAFDIDTTKARNGENVARARHQTLVVMFVATEGSTIAVDATMTLWSKADWDESSESPAAGSSSSSSSPDIGEPGELPEANRWALIETVKLSDVPAGATGSKAFSFPWVPAGVYRAVISSGLSGSAVVVEQHTE